MVDADVQVCTAGKEFIRLHGRITAGRVIGFDLNQFHQDISVHRHQSGMQVGGVALSVGAGFQFEEISIDTLAQRKRPVDNLAVLGHRCFSGRRVVVEQYAFRVVDRELLCGGVPCQLHPLSIAQQHAFSVCWMQRDRIGATLGWCMVAG